MQAGKGEGGGNKRKGGIDRGKRWPVLFSGKVYKKKGDVRPLHVLVRSHKKVGARVAEREGKWGKTSWSEEEKERRDKASAQTCGRKTHVSSSTEPGEREGKAQSQKGGKSKSKEMTTMGEGRRADHPPFPIPTRTAKIREFPKNWERAQAGEEIHAKKRRKKKNARLLKMR